MSSEPSRLGFTERIVASGVVQAHAVDALLWIGAVLIGIGVWQLSKPATWIYAGVALITFAVLAALSAGAARAQAQKRREE